MSLTGDGGRAWGGLAGADAGAEAGDEAGDEAGLGDEKGTGLRTGRECLHILGPRLHARVLCGS